MKTPSRIMHLITGLNTGGAEIMLYRLARTMQQRGYEQIVVSMIPIGSVGRLISETGIPVYSLDLDPKNPGWHAAKALLKLLEIIRDFKPQIIQSWMYHANLLGSIAAPLAGRIPLIWGIHNAATNVNSRKITTRATIWFTALISRWAPSKIIVCSEEGLKRHQKLGYDPAKLVFIPNGFDLTIFHPDLETRKIVRQDLGVEDENLIFGLVARNHPDKDPENFVRAASIMAKIHKNAIFVLCGDGFTDQNKELSKIIPVELKKRFRLLGRRDKIEQIMNALDIFVLSSATEAFPLTLGEAMACGLPGIVTDVGDSKNIVAETGFTVQPHNTKELADAMIRMSQLPAGERTKLGISARRRIEQYYSIVKVTDEYCEIYELFGKSSIKLEAEKP